jgi:hypothetical protein
LKKTITSIIAAGALAVTTMVSPTPAAAHPLVVPLVVVGAVLLGTAATKAQQLPPFAKPAQGTITVKKSRKRR